VANKGARGHRGNPDARAVAACPGRVPEETPDPLAMNGFARRPRRSPSVERDHRPNG